MDTLILLVLLSVLLPLIGAFWNGTAVLIMAGLAWACLAGALFSALNTPLQWILLAQIPFVSLVTYISIKTAGQRKFNTDQSDQFSPVPDLSKEHQALKASMLRAGKEEAASLLIYGAAKGLAESLSWKDMAPRLTASIQKIFGGYEFLLFSIGDKGKQELLHRRGSWSRDFPIEAMVSEKSVMVKPPETSEVVPVLCVPIFSGHSGEIHQNGLLIMKSPAGNREDSDLTHAGDEFGIQIGMALDKAKLFSQMENHSRMDGLTGVLRRQVFMDRMDEEFKRAGVFHTPFSAMMIDIDHFKAVNDSHGHGAGDAVLKRLGEILKGSIYETDVVGRYGGEEFILLMPKAQREGALRKAEILRKKIEEDEISIGFEKLRITVSIGVAHFPDSARTKEALIAAADKALYQAKETGRNRVIEG